VVLGSRHQLGEAVLHLRRAVDINPLDADVQNNLGVALSVLGKREEALIHFREALKLRPDHGGAQRNMDVLVNAAEPSNVIR
jgi:Flp pilus assembly protein TadD